MSTTKDDEVRPAEPTVSAGSRLDSQTIQPEQVSQSASVLKLPKWERQKVNADP